MGVKIESVFGLQVIDSRGNPTVAVQARLSDGSTGTASVPSGASTGEFEAIELRDGDPTRFRGKGVTKAVANVNGPIRAALSGADPFNQSAIDRTLIDLDGTPNKAKLGANAILGVSLAVAHAAAASRKIPLFALLGGEEAVQLPVPMVNVINGGAHANNSLDIQEFMIVPHGAPTYADAIRISADIFHTLGKLLKDDGYNTGVGDEGGYAPRLETMDLAFEYLLRAIDRSGYKAGDEVSLALDVAASELVQDNGSVRYRFSKSSLGEFSSSELTSLYESWMAKYPIVSIEDGHGENDWAGWSECTKRLGGKVQLVGDDLFVTNTERIKRGINDKIANSVLIKLNQIGTLTETLDAIQTARTAGYTNIISHRSGETADTTIADLAVGLNTGQIKTGSMCRAERTEKYNRLLWIEQTLGSKAKYCNPFKK